MSCFVVFRKLGKCLRLAKFTKCVEIINNSFSVDFGPMVFSIFLIYIKFEKQMICIMSIFEKINFLSYGEHVDCAPGVEMALGDPVKGSHSKKSYF